MLISHNWLSQYVPLEMSVEELARRLMMAGLNHESTKNVGDDWCIDLEVTSNRPDCLGHLGIAREVAAIWNVKMMLPPAGPKEGKTPVENLVKVRIDCPDLCLHYNARVIRGVKIGPSPAWLAKRLETVGITPINNVVDISNYVLMECGQPLHTFDFGRVEGNEIIVRRPQPGETIEAIDHKTYVLGPEMCMICDARRPVAIGGVMGGAWSEITTATRDVLIEAAEFNPVSIRNTARTLNLHSDSSYRFERRVDPEGLDWASRRCCELILELAGGELAAGAVDVGQPPPKREPIVLRTEQIKRILGIEVPVERVREILLSLGMQEAGKEGSGFRVQGSVASGERGEGRGERGEISGEWRVASGENSSTVVPKSPDPQIPKSPSANPQSLIPNPSFLPPSWRRDLTREIDLIEEVGRIHGYDAIPEDVSVPMVPSSRRRDDRVLERIRHVLSAAGFDEAVTISVVDEKTSASLSPWTDAAPLHSSMPVIRGADCLRRSLTPSLLAVRKTNEALANSPIELFEIARAYLPQATDLPREEPMLAISSGRDHATVRGVIETILDELKIVDPLQSEASNLAILDPMASCRLRFRNETFGYVGQLLPEALVQFDLRGPTCVAEIMLAPLVEAADLVPRCVPQSPYPAVTRDLNLVVDETVRWADIAATVREHGGPAFESLEYRDTYRDPARLGNKKSLLFTVSLRSAQGTLTNAEADQARDQIVAACREKYRAELRT